MEKYEIYKKMHEDLKKAMIYEFYYEAIFIEYAIFEDRFNSLMKYGNVKYLDKYGNPIGIKQKINKARNNPIFTTDFVRKRITLEMLDQIESWKDRRNKLIHALATTKYDEESVKQIALEGNDLIKVFSNKVQSVNNHNKKLLEK